MECHTVYGCGITRHFFFCCLHFPDDVIWPNTYPHIRTLLTWSTNGQNRLKILPWNAILVVLGPIRNKKQLTNDMWRMFAKPNASLDVAFSIVFGVPAKCFVLVNFPGDFCFFLIAYPKVFTERSSTSSATRVCKGCCFGCMLTVFMGDGDTLKTAASTRRISTLDRHTEARAKSTQTAFTNCP